MVRINKDDDSERKAIPVYVSSVMKRIYKRALKIAHTNLNVLILGETGTGKEILANFIHLNSSRYPRGKLIILNCSAFPDNLVESEAFGYVTGAFTGAVKNKIGLFTVANDGTLVLDEVDSLPLILQPKFLRALANHEYYALGSTDPIKSNFRLICTANSDIEKNIELKLFRSDLYFRIREFLFIIPPLRQRKEDIAILSRQILNEEGFENICISLEVMNVFLNYSWPGNIRELRNILKASAQMLENETIIQLEHIESESFHINDLSGYGLMNLDENVENYAYSFVKNALDLCKGNVSEAAKLIDTSRDKIYRILGKHSH